MLLALTLLVMGGTVLFTGPVQAVVVNFTVVGETTTTMDSPLCPNRTYTFSCEVNNTDLQFRSFDNDNEVINTYDLAAGFSSSQSEFDFAAMSSGSGLIGTATVDSSTGLMSARLVCMDLIDDDFSSLSTIVKHPLAVPVLVDQTCFSYDGRVTFIKLTWEPVDCAELYILDIPGFGRVNTSETFIERAFFGFAATNISGSLFAVGGSALKFLVMCFNPSPTTSESSPPPPPPPPPGTSSITPGDDSPGDVSCYRANNTEIRVGTNVKTRYTITFIYIPEGGTAYYNASDGRKVILVTEGIGEITTDSTVTIYVAFPNDTVYCSQPLQEPSISGENVLFFWTLFAILLLVVLCGLVCGFAIYKLVKWVIGKTKIANEEKSNDNIDLGPVESEMKTRGSDM